MIPVLLTGAGGFIGSALARAIADAGTSHLILLDSSEQNLFAIHRGLTKDGIPHEPILGSVTDAALLDSIFTRFRPRIVYHAAALKHVSLLEFNPLAAVHNNALGAYTLARAALRHGAESLILVSTDKAVNPRGIMGASKRLAELTIAALSGGCRMNAVRLGNVYGSTGSAVPIFLEQIAAGGPVTVTDPQATRYFISLDAAVDAILAAADSPVDGCILLPDLGEPRRILDLARSLIGAAPIEIEFIGLRPGEKLREELVSATEVREGRTASGLEIIRTPSPSPAELDEHMARIARQLAARDLAAVLETMRPLAPEYQPSGSLAP
jgi:FlaA1/EpsC-like NDP-sugar epimerase